MESKIFSFFAALFSKIAMWFDESAVGKLYDKICARCYKTFSESAVGGFFMHEPKRNDVFANSLFGKLIGLPGRFLLFLRSKLSGYLKSVAKTSGICRAVNSWSDISIRFYGIVLVVFSVIVMLFKIPDPLRMAVCAAGILIGILAILINRSIRQLFGGSVLMSAFINLFLEADAKEHDAISCKGRNSLFAVASGVILSFLCVALGVKVFALLVMGVIAFAFLLKYLRLGVFLTVIFSPMLPTMALVGLSLLCAAVFCVHVVMDEEFTFAKNPMNSFVAFFAIALIWGCINSFAVATSVTQVMVHISFILFYFIVINTIRTRQQWMAMIKLFLISAFAVAAYGVLQNFIGVSSTESWLDEEMFKSIEVRVYSFFNNPNVLGEFLVMTIPVTLAVIWGKMRQEHKVFFGVIFIAMAACMIFTWSRGAWLGMVLACAIFFAIMDRRWVFLGILGVMALPLLLVITNNTAILERFLSIGNTADSSTAYRVSIWQAATKIIRDFWVPGIGIGSEAFKMVYPVYSLSGADFALHSHNLYLQIWVEMGIIGIVSLFAMIFMLIRQTFSAKITTLRKTDSAAKIVIALGAGILGFLFQGLTDYVWYNYKILMIFWIMIALAISGANIVKNDVANEGGVSVK